MEIGERIKSLRKKVGVTQKELSIRSKIPETSIRKYEAGDKQPEDEHLSKIAFVLGITMNDLVPISNSDFKKKCILKSKYIFNEALLSLQVCIKDHDKEYKGKVSNISEDKLTIFMESLIEDTKFLTFDIERVINGEIDIEIINEVYLKEVKK